MWLACRVSPAIDPRLPNQSVRLGDFLFDHMQKYEPNTSEWQIIDATKTSSRQADCELPDA